MTRFRPVLRTTEAGWITLDWLPDPPGGLWHVLPAPPAGIDQREVPACLPQRRQLSPPKHPGYGRPRLVDSDRTLVENVAVLVDVCGWSALEVTRRLSDDDDEAQRKRVFRQLASGRELLALLGVLPWSAFPEGRVPRRWDQAEETTEWLWQWGWQARIFPAQGSELLNPPSD